MPTFEQVSSTIENLASSAQYAVVCAKINEENKAQFTIGLINDYISIKRKFGNLDLNDRVSTENSENSVKVRVDIVKMNYILNAIALIKPTTISCSISHEMELRFDFFNELGNYQVIIPNFQV